MSAVLPQPFLNISLKTLFFFFISVYLLINTNVSAHHIHSGCECTILELMDLPVRTIQANTLININQRSCQRFFEFTVDEATMEKQFIILEVIYEEIPADWSFSPILVEKDSGRPIVLMTRHIPLTQNIDNMDYNAYTARKLYHHITLSTQEVSLNDTLYFGVYFVFDSLAVDTNFSLPYTIQLRTTETYPCPGNCSGNGVCDETQQQCICETGYFDEDCSVRATELTPETLVTMKLAGMGRGLYYMKMNNRSTKGMTLDIEKSAGPAKFSLSFNNPDDYSLPTGRCDADSYSFESNSVQTSFSLDQDSCENRNHQILVIEPINLQSQGIIINARVDLFEDEIPKRTNLLPLFIVLGVLATLLAFWGTISILKARSLRLRHARVHGLEGIPAEPLSQEEIQKYYPEASFNSINVSFIQTTCSICIEEFEESVACRKLHCDHIFHKKCIDSWLSSRSSCPNCKKEMSRECLEKIYQNQKKSQLQQKLRNPDDDNLKIEVLDSLEKHEIPLPPSLCTALSEGPINTEIQLSDRFGSNLLSESSNELRDLTLRRVSSRQAMIQSRNINTSPRSDMSQLQ